MCRREIPCLPLSNNCRASSVSATLRSRLGCPMRCKSYLYMYPAVPAGGGLVLSGVAIGRPERITVHERLRPARRRP
jgi:hypothetical protein